MDKVATWSIRTEAFGVESATEISLVLWMTWQRPQLMDTVSELALVTVLAKTVLLKRSTQLRLVSAWNMALLSVNRSRLVQCNNHMPAARWSASLVEKITGGERSGATAFH